MDAVCREAAVAGVEHGAEGALEEEHQRACRWDQAVRHLRRTREETTTRQKEEMDLGSGSHRRPSP